LEVPEGVVGSMMRVYQATEEFQENFEDFACSADESFLKKMRTARKEHRQGKIRSIKDLECEL